MELNFKHKDQINLYGKRQTNQFKGNNFNSSHTSGDFKNRDTLNIFEERYKTNKEGIDKINQAKQVQREFDKNLYNNVSQNNRINNNVNNLNQVKRDMFRDKF